MNTMADGAAQRLVAQIGEALFGQPGLTLMELAEKVKASPNERAWPFVESPGEFTARLESAMQQFPLIGAVRHVLIENPPTLAAHPSPAGQVDALPAPPKPGFVTGGDFGHEAHNAFTPEQMRDYARAALATLQPVSETDAYQQGFRDGQDRTCTVVARQPVSEVVSALHNKDVFSKEGLLKRIRESGQSVDPERGNIDPSWSLHDRVEFALRDAGFDLDEAAFVAEAADRARQPVGQEPDAWVPAKFFEQGVNAMTARRKPSDVAIAAHGLYVPLFRHPAPPEQAVDLGQFREAVTQWKLSAERVIRCKGHAMAEEKVKVRDEAVRLLALIDGNSSHG